MQIQVQSPGTTLPDALAGQVRRRLGFALDRFHQAVERVQVLLVREGRRRDSGEEPHRCQVRLHTRGRRPRLVVTAVAGDAASAVSLAARRAVRALRRRTSRRQTGRRTDRNPTR